MDTMPAAVSPAGYEFLEDVIEAYGNPLRVAILSELVRNGPITAGSLAILLDIKPTTVKKQLYALVATGVVIGDPPATEERSGIRVRYTANRDEMWRRYRSLGLSLGFDDRLTEGNPR